MRRINILIFALPFFLFSCKDDKGVTDEPTPENPSPSGANPQLSGTMVAADFFGKISDMEGEPIPGAIIEIGDKTTTSSSEGFYTIENASVDEDFALVKVTANGFLDQFRNLKPSTSNHNRVSMSMLTRTVTGTFEAEAGGEVIVPGGGNVIFLPEL